MGFCVESTPEMGEYSVEVRSESFYLNGEYNVLTEEELESYQAGETMYHKRRHGIVVYENGETGQGTTEILIEDIPKLRAALDEVERHLEKAPGPNLDEIVAKAHEREKEERPDLGQEKQELQKVEF
jgi:hypothetical protein